MASIKGDISVMSLTDLLQWIDLTRKTGTITAIYQGTEKKIYSELIFAVFKSIEEKKTGIGNNS